MFNIVRKEANDLYSYRKCRDIYERISDFKFHKELKYSEKRIKLLLNRHKNERCFIIGTGSSLNNTNFSLIKDEILFGVNSLFKGFNKFHINCQYWVVSDCNVFKEYNKKILYLNTDLFLCARVVPYYLVNRDHFQKNQTIEPILIHQLGTINVSNKISKNLIKGTYNGKSVILHAIQIAYYMGFKEVYLLGCDCDYSGTPHFDGSKVNTKTGMAIGDMSDLYFYKICKNAFENDNRKIYNATVGGNLGIFERKKLEEII